MYNLFVFSSCWLPVERRSCARRVLNLSDRSSNAFALPTCLFSMKLTLFLHTASCSESPLKKKKISIAHFKNKKGNHDCSVARCGSCRPINASHQRGFEKVCVRVRSTRWKQRHKTQTSLFGFGSFFLSLYKNEVKGRLVWKSDSFKSSSSFS